MNEDSDLVYTLDTERRDTLKADLKGSYPMVPDFVIDPALSEIALLIGGSGPKDLEALLAGAPQEKRDVLREKYAEELAEKIDIPMVMKSVEKEWLAAFIDRVFDAALQDDQAKLTEAYLKAKLAETEDEDED
eukprot:CAMPEP_0181317336 /NCGR_PEP_ID=MMETSP1101-20121128/16414_1 /TAXON_ID=46948 /ORGANISM="Rhodomonas abbreviata, Strain Caron Lab Isolate" /LENGTH=132 /DNA_ID=CAMNT_0023424723 /DNA_START=225 /DNA_END=623 /DNA_ORIENTATION=-